MIDLDQRKISLTGVRNTRELGGIPVSGGRVVKKGLLIRCSRLSDMTAQDARILEEQYHVTEIIDLRNPQETIEHPDRPIGQATWEGISLLPDMLAGISKEDGSQAEAAAANEENAQTDEANMQANGTDRQEAEGNQGDFIDHCIRMVRGWGVNTVDQMRNLYLMMATSEHTTVRMKEFLRAWMEHGEGAFLWHCTSGKDRTGITAALILWILGASREDIETEYNDTNQLTADHLHAFEQEVFRRTGDAAFAKDCTIVEAVHPSCIKAYLDTLEERYGSIDAYLSGPMGITEADRQAMREKYTEPA